MPPDLWRFAQLLYARPGVETACLQLQADGSDVCLLLCGLWLEKCRVGCTAPRLLQLTELATPWQALVVIPLRQLRQEWRAGAHDDPELGRLREQIKGLELQAEQQLLLRLEAKIHGWVDAREETGPALWLESLTSGRGRDALQVLRAAAGSA